MLARHRPRSESLHILLGTGTLRVGRTCTYTRSTSASMQHTSNRMPMCFLLVQNSVVAVCLQCHCPRSMCGMHARCTCGPSSDRPRALICVVLVVLCSAPLCLMERAVGGVYDCQSTYTRLQMCSAGVQRLSAASLCLWIAPLQFPTTAEGRYCATIVGFGVGDR